MQNLKGTDDARIPDYGVVITKGRYRQQTSVSLKTVLNGHVIPENYRSTDFEEI
jgi:hypothetical protein